MIILFSCPPLGLHLPKSSPEPRDESSAHVSMNSAKIINKTQKDQHRCSCTNSGKEKKKEMDRGQMDPIHLVSLDWAERIFQIFPTSHVFFLFYLQPQLLISNNTNSVSLVHNCISHLGIRNSFLFINSHKETLSGLPLSETLVEWQWQKGKRWQLVEVGWSHKMRKSIFQQKLFTDFANQRRRQGALQQNFNHCHLN